MSLTDPFAGPRTVGPNDKWADYYGTTLREAVTALDNQIRVAAADWITAGDTLIIGSVYGGQVTKVVSSVDGTTVTLTSNVGQAFAVNAPVTFRMSDAVHPYIDVQDYGVARDGVTDDYADIQTALTAASATGATVVMPPGDYYVATAPAVPSGVNILAFGARIFGSFASNRVMSLAGNNRIEGLTVENTDTSTGNIGINLSTGATDITITRCKFPGSRRTQAINIAASGCARISVTDNYFDGVSYGVLANNPSAGDLVGLQVIGNRFDNIYNDAVEINSPSTAYAGCSDIIVSDNWINVPGNLGSGLNSGMGVGIAGAQYVVISNNIIAAARLQGIHIEDEAKHVTISGNIIRNIGGEVSANNDGIHIIDVVDCSIVGNQIYDAEDYGICWLYSPLPNDPRSAVISANTVAASGGVGISAGSAGTFLNLSITDNVVTGCGGNGIEYLGVRTGLIIDGNICSGNTGYGLSILRGSGHNFIGHNMLQENTAGDINVNTSNGTPAILTTRTAKTTGTIAGGATPWTDLLPLASVAAGQVAVRAESGATNMSHIYNLAWDGTTLTATSVGVVTYGAMNSLTVQAAGGKLQVKSTWAAAADGVVVTFDCEFTGQMFDT